MPKVRTETQSEETKQESELDSDMKQMLELSEREFKITVINVNGSSGKSRQHVRTDEGCKQRSFFKVVKFYHLIHQQWIHRTVLLLKPTELYSTKSES